MNRQVETIKDDSMHKAFGFSTNNSKIKVFGWNQKVGAVGEFKRISKNDLKLDISYQREIDNANRIKEIAKNFEWALFGCLIVCNNKDGYYVIDGGHRLRAAFRRDDIDDLPCLVYKFNDPTEEARIFYYYNNKRKNVSIFDNHKAAIRGEGNFYESEIALKAEALVKKYGYRFSSSTNIEFTTSSVRTICKSIIKNENIAEKTFSFLAKVAAGVPITNKEYTGLFYLMQMNPSINFFDFPLKKAIEIGFGNLIEQIKLDTIVEHKGGEKVIARSIANILNSGETIDRVIVP